MADNKGSEFVDDFYDEDDEDAMENKFLTFTIGDEDYGIEIRYVTEIVGIQKITEVPDMPDYMKGVINLRGSVIPVIDVRLRFHMEERAYDDRTCVVVVQLEEAEVGFVVDTVREVMDIPPDQVAPPPSVNRGAGGRFILGMGKVGDNVKILLDVSKLLYEEELQKITETAGE